MPYGSDRIVTVFFQYICVYDEYATQCDGTAQLYMLKLTGFVEYIDLICKIYYLLCLYSVFCIRYIFAEIEFHHFIMVIFEFFAISNSLQFWIHRNPKIIGIFSYKRSTLEMCWFYYTNTMQMDRKSISIVVKMSNKNVV